MLLERCIRYRSHTIRGRSQTVGEAYEMDQAHLIPFKGYGTMVRIYYRNEEVATYPRSYIANTVQYQLSHYIDLLEKRPRAVLNAKPVKEAHIPQEILQWGQKLPAGNRDMVKLLRLVVDYGTERILKEIEGLKYISSPTIELLRSRLTDSDDSGVMDNVIPFPADVPVKEVSLSSYDMLLAGGDKNHE